MLEPINRRHWAAWAATGAVAAIALAVLAWLPIETDPRFSICFSRRILNLSCPGCGMTRAFALIARGQLSASLAFHPLALPLALEAAAIWLAWPLVLLRTVARPSTQVVNAWLLVHLALLVGTWAVRLVTGTLP